MRAWPLITAAALLFAGAAARDGLDRWVAATDLPPLLAETSVEMRGRDGSLLRVYTSRDGRWRLGAGPDRIDRRYLDMLVAYEDKRFRDHGGVDGLAMTRAVAQAVWHGKVWSRAARP